MDWVIDTAKFLVNEILSQPAYLIGIITAVGLAALKKSVGQRSAAPSRRPWACCWSGQARGWSARPWIRWAG